MGEKILSIWWFAVLAVVAASVMLVSWMFYSSDINMRGIETDALSMRVSGCLIRLGEMNADIFNETFDIYGTCKIKKEIIENGNYFLAVRIYSGDKILKQMDWGIRAFEEDCKVKQKIINSKGSAYYFPECSTREFFVSRAGEKLRVEIIGGSNNAGAYL